MITTNNVYFPIQAALDGLMIALMFISDDIVKCSKKILRKNKILP